MSVGTNFLLFISITFQIQLFMNTNDNLFNVPTTLIDGIERYLVYKTELNGKCTDERIKSISNIMMLTIPLLKMETLSIEQSNTGLMSELLARMKKDRKVSNKRYNDYRCFIKNCFDYFYNMEWINRNPIIPIAKLKEESTQYHKPFNDNEVAMIYDYLKGNNTFLLRFIDFFRFSGIRPKEIIHLTVGSIDTLKWTITVNSSEAKTRTKRVIEIPIEYISELEKLNLNHYPKSFYLFSNKAKGIGIKKSGKNTFCHAFKKVKDALGLDKFHTLYGFRSTTVLIVYEQNQFNPQAAQEYLGHTNGRSTYNYLSRPDARALRKRKFVFPKLQR